MKVFNHTIDYTTIRTPLCDIAARCGTDKTVYHSVPHLHKHPYTQWYHTLLELHRDEMLTIGEIGILDNASIRMWREYLPNAHIIGFEYDVKRIQTAQAMNLDNARYYRMNVEVADTITSALQTDSFYDVLIDDSTHQVQDQIRIARLARPWLKTRGVLIIEDVFRATNEQVYIDALQDTYRYATFVTCNHELEHSPGWDNSKLLILKV
jgi:predicted O-methyltransferase YrrM